jgi:alkaline phosphatase
MRKDQVGLSRLEGVASGWSSAAGGGRRRGLRCAGVVLAVLLAGCANRTMESGTPLLQAEDPWFVEGERALDATRARRPIGGRAKNLVLFVGDGLDVSTVTAARIFEGQARGATGEENLLAFERLPHRALLKTYNTNQQVADSAGAGTALLTGVKTRAGVIALDADVARGDCAGSEGHEVDSLVALAQRSGRATGIVTTTRLTHATPAVAYGHSPERGWESDADLPARAVREGCIDLARQLIEGPVGRRLQVVFGGGGAEFVARVGPDGSRAGGRRLDGLNLVARWQDLHPDGLFVEDRAGLLAADPGGGAPVFGLFGADHLPFEQDRDPGKQPSLAELTARALDFLSRDRDGFVLLVEAGRIDHAHHVDKAYRALLATVELARAVEVVLERTDPEDTLVVVTSDHGHTLTISGYPTRGNPILGLVVENDDRGEPLPDPALASDGRPYTTLGYANGPSARTGARSDPGRSDPTAPNFQQPALVPLEMETHGGADVPAYASGPQAHLLVGTFEQNYVFNVARFALGLGGDR